MVPIDIKDKKFGRLKVISYAKVSRGTGHAKWLCICTCGNKIVVRASHLKTGNVSSCGCRAREVSRKLLKKYASSDAHKGKGNPQWKGNNAKHAAIHTWLNKHYRKIKCELCDKTYPLDWALRKNKKHSHNVKNYRVLCRSHHLIYDYTFERRAKISKTLTNRKHL